MGNLVRDPEVRSGSGNGSFTTFSLAINDGFGDKKKVYFMDFVASGKTGENIGKFFQKGKQIIVEGKLYTAKNKQSQFDEVRLQVWKFHFTSDGTKQGNGGGNGYNNNNNQGGGNGSYNNQNNNNNNGGNGGYNNNNNGGQGNNNNQNQGNNNGGGQGQGPVDDIPF